MAKRKSTKGQTTIYKTYIDNVKTGPIFTVLCQFEHDIKKRGKKHKCYKQQR